MIHLIHAMFVDERSSRLPVQRSPPGSTGAGRDTVPAPGRFPR